MCMWAEQSSYNAETVAKLNEKMHCGKYPLLCYSLAQMHAWYLVEESVILLLFGSASNEAKQAIADELRLMPHPEEFR